MYRPTLILINCLGGENGVIKSSSFLVELTYILLSVIRETLADRIVY